jgi:hypothetical protein
MLLFHQQGERAWMVGNKFLMDKRIKFSLVQSGEDQYLFLKTKQTGHSKDYERGGSGFVERYQIIECHS